MIFLELSHRLLGVREAIGGLPRAMVLVELLPLHLILHGAVLEGALAHNLLHLVLLEVHLLCLVLGLPHVAGANEVLRASTRTGQSCNYVNSGKIASSKLARVLSKKTEKKQGGGVCRKKQQNGTTLKFLVHEKFSFPHVVVEAQSSNPFFNVHRFMDPASSKNGWLSGFASLAHLALGDAPSGEGVLGALLRALELLHDLPQGVALGRLLGEPLHACGARRKKRREGYV